MQHKSIGLKMRFSSFKTGVACVFASLLGLWGLACQASDTDRPSQASLLIQSSPLAGSQYHALPEIVDQIRVGDALTLKREPDNPYDRNAVQVLWQGQLLGFVPRRENKAVARAMDRGAPLIARVVALRPEESPWRRLRFDISMPLDASPHTENRPPNQTPQQPSNRSEPMLRSAPSNPVSY